MWGQGRAPTSRSKADSDRRQTRPRRRSPPRAGLPAARSRTGVATGVTKSANCLASTRFHAVRGPRLARLLSSRTSSTPMVHRLSACCHCCLRIVLVSAAVNAHAWSLSDFRANLPSWARNPRWVTVEIDFRAATTSNELKCRGRPRLVHPTDFPRQLEHPNWRSE